MRRPSLALAALLIVAACSRNTGLPDPNSSQYRELVSAFYVGVAALQTGEDVRAKEKLTRATELAPAEPAIWTNLGLLAARQQDLESAYRNVERGRSLAPDNSRIETLLGLVESRRGRLPEAIAHLQKAVQLDGKNVRAMFALSRETERQALPTSDAAAQQWLEKILETQPDNLAVLLEAARLAAKRGAADTLRAAVTNLSRNSGSWPAEAKQQ